MLFSGGFRSNEKHLTVDFPPRLWSSAKSLAQIGCIASQSTVQPHLASPVGGLPVDVELKVLVLVHEAPPRLEDGKVAGVLLREQVGVVAVRELSLDLDRLEADLKKRIYELALLSQCSHIR